MESPIDACSSRLTIDLDALRANYRTIATRVAPARCGAVVKANAYGLGVAMAAPALYREGCRSFFVAQLCEADPLARAIGPDAVLFILNGLDPGSEAACARAGFVPVLNSRSQIERWRALARAQGRALPAALQIDSGMSRLGLPPTEAVALAGDAAWARDIDLRLLMTHLACADEPDRAANAEQLARFDAVRAHFPAVPLSIANSGGAFLPSAFHHDLVRPGIALYGADPGPNVEGLRAVVKLEARVLQIRTIAAGTGVGYGLGAATARDHRHRLCRRLAAQPGRSRRGMASWRPPAHRRARVDGQPDDRHLRPARRRACRRRFRRAARSVAAGGRRRTGRGHHRL